MAGGTAVGPNIGIMALSANLSVLADVTSVFALGQCDTSYGDIVGLVVSGGICSAYVGIEPGNRVGTVGGGGALGVVPRRPAARA